MEEVIVVGDVREQRVSVSGGGGSEPVPAFSVVVGNIPESVLNLEFRGDSVGAICAVCAVCAVSAIGSVSTVSTIGAIGPDPVALLIQQPLSIQGPVIVAILSLLDAYDRGASVLSIFTVGTVFPVSAILSVLTIIYGDVPVFEETDFVTYGFALRLDRGD